nr:hypothetical protein [Angustibacter aerolatus]
MVSTLVYGVTTLGFALTGSTSRPSACCSWAASPTWPRCRSARPSCRRAPAADRGRVVGLYGMSANGLRAGSGFTVGLLGAAVGVHVSLGLSAAALVLGTLLAGVVALRALRPTTT